ncbi:MAG: uracil-DNA glycosylase, partial [Myxococcota bacterium]|nr:uracil-DNA glycosylase [Myxococcota bacterium]
MTGSIADEARSVLGSARALLEELAEEGVQAAGPPPETIETPAPEPVETSTHEPETSIPAGAAEAPLPAREIETRPAAQPVLLDGHPWGADPSLDDVRSELGDCTRCRLSEGRTNIVFGDGNPAADLMFVGEGPGQNEDVQGLPFVGRAGELLTQMIEKGLGIPRSDVYICNVVKCRPPNNRTPLADEVSACSPFLDGQIAAVKPRVIVALGKPAASLLLGRDVPITRVRG